jgi:hypothetical protein
MNQDNIKESLLGIADTAMDFSVVFSGKKSRKVNGLYKPDTREIVIHNRNFSQDEKGDNLLVYTAIHEYAHHQHSCRRGGKLPVRAHTTEFWAIFHELLSLAEEKGIYKNTMRDSPELLAITETIRRFMTDNGNMVKELGAALLKAGDCCTAVGLRFEDYIDRILCLPRGSAKLAMKAHQYNLKPELGPDNMRFLAGISDDDARASAEEALVSGKSPDFVKVASRMAAQPPEADPREKLEKERLRLQRTIDSLSKRLAEIDAELAV